MIFGPFFQIIITVWLHGHALNYTLPHIYSSTDFDACRYRVDQLFEQRKQGVRVRISCEPTDHRNI